MQPTLILRAPHPGILYLNGRFTGGLGSEDALARPVNPRGAVYLDYRPLSAACRGMARKLVFSGGEPMAQSAEEAEGLDIVLWPGGAVEVEFAPEPRRERVRFQAAGRSLTLSPDGQLTCEGRELAILPPGAQAPAYIPLPTGAAFTGPCDGGRYLLTADAALRAQTGLLRAKRIDIDPGGEIRALATRDDEVGHATLERWRLTPEGLTLLGSESAWEDGAPRRPRSARDTAIAAVEAALAGLTEEADGYLTPALRERAPLANIRARCDLCTPMKYAVPDARPCVGLLRLEAANLARVRPLYYRAVEVERGSWQIEEFEKGDSQPQERQ